MNDSNPTSAKSLARFHLRVGWWCLAAFLALGLLLESFHGFKAGFYLDASNETRRLMFTLAHAHGTLFGLVHIAFALSLPALERLQSGRARLASRALVGGTILMPLGFLLGGLFVWEGDPGLPVLLAPVGGVLVLVSVLAIARATATSAD